MNLIEQLGGYAQAKALRALPAATYDCGIKFNREKLELSMLEYRRQHNIFEVGDRVVLLKNQHMWHKMESIYTVTSTDIYDGITIGVAVAYKNTSHGNEIGNIRHATDEEIAAGKRLEVK